MIQGEWKFSRDIYLFIFYKQGCTICSFPGGVGNMWIDHTAAGLVGLGDMFSRCFQNLEFQVSSNTSRDRYLSSGLAFQIMFISLHLGGI